MCHQSHFSLGLLLSRLRGRIGIHLATRKLGTSIIHTTFLTYLNIHPVKQLICACFFRKHASQVHTNVCMFYHLNHKLGLLLECNQDKYKHLYCLNERSLHMAGTFFWCTL